MCIKKILISQSNRIHAMFVSAAENGWLAFLGPNKEKIVE